MKRIFSTGIAGIAWFAVVTQYVLMLENRVADITETTVRFFSFFTILTNMLVALYFTLRVFNPIEFIAKFMRKPAFLTTITVYITVVGLVYQVVLRSIWEPTGMQRVVDELLHSVIPLTVVVFWFLYDDTRRVNLRNIPVWLVYPFLYMQFILLRGSFSGFYPYPFMNIGELGGTQVIINAALLLVVFIFLFVVFVWIGRRTRKTDIQPAEREHYG